MVVCIRVIEVPAAKHHLRDGILFSHCLSSCWKGSQSQILTGMTATKYLLQYIILLLQAASTRDQNIFLHFSFPKSRENTSNADWRQIEGRSLLKVRVQGRACIRHDGFLPQRYLSQQIFKIELFPVHIMLFLESRE